MSLQHRTSQIKLLAVISAICLLFASCGKSSGNNSSYNDFNNQNNSILNESNITENQNEAVLHKTEVPEGYIGIYTIEDLINSGANENGKYILMNDLDLSSVSDWKGIRNEEIFDGNNYVIKNLKSTKGGLFSYAKSLRNFKLEEIDIKVNISAKKDESCRILIGGLVDCGGSTYNCSTSGNITLLTNPESFVDMFNVLHYPDSEEYLVGGVMGKLLNQKDETISHCVNYCNINVKNNGDTTPDTSVGGIVGLGFGIISDCKNFGQIRLEANDSHKAFAGGICGKAADCYRSNNCGEVFSVGFAGGIVGYIDVDKSTIDSCYNSGNIISRQHQSLDDYLGEAKGSCVGGIAGYINYHAHNALISNSYNVGTCSGADNCGAIVGGRYNYDGLDIKYCAYCIEDNIGITGDSAMFADNKEMTLDEMKELNNYPFNNKDAWKNGTGEYPYPVIK